MLGMDAQAAGVLGTPLASAAPAKTTILFFLCGGSSHVDMWDMKPDAPSEYRSIFRPIRTSAPEIRLCEHLPMTAKVADKLAIVRSVTDYGRATGDHHAGYYYNLTGHAPDQTFRTQGNNRRPYSGDWPFMGSVIGSRRPAHPDLPQLITLPHKPSRPPFTRPGQFAGILGPRHDALYVNGSNAEPMKFTAPSLTLQTSKGRLEDRRQLLNALDSARADLDKNPAVSGFGEYHQEAFSLLSSSTTASAFDLKDESESTIERYGKTINGMSLLMARRLAEAQVPFITVFWKGDTSLNKKCKSAGSWDTHGNNFNCLRDNLLPEFDRAYSALIEDLSQRGMLDDTLVLLSSEMGRKPKIGDVRSGGVSGAGRDHWTVCQSIVMAGGGVRGGQTFGKTDAYGELPVESAVGPEDITKTVYHAMGISDLRARDAANRPINLLSEGRALTELF